MNEKQVETKTLQNLFHSVVVSNISASHFYLPQSETTLTGKKIFAFRQSIHAERWRLKGRHAHIIKSFKKIPLINLESSNFSCEAKETNSHVKNFSTNKITTEGNKIRLRFAGEENFEGASLEESLGISDRTNRESEMLFDIKICMRRHNQTMKRQTQEETILWLLISLNQMLPIHICDGTHFDTCCFIPFKTFFALML